MNSLKSRVVRVVRGKNLELAEGNDFWFEFEREIRKIQVSRNWLRFRFLQPLCLVIICSTFVMICSAFDVICGAFIIICGTFVIICSAFVFICGAFVIICGGFVII